MCTVHVVLAHDIEKEGICVVVKCFVVEEAFSEEAEILGVSLVLPTVELKDADSLVFFFWIFVSESIF